MRIHKDKKKLIISVLVGFLATLVVYSQLQNQSQQIQSLEKQIQFFKDNENSESYNYVVANADVKRGTVLTKDKLGIKNYTTKISGAYENIGDLENKVLIQDVKAGDIVSETSIAQTSSSYNGYNLPKGMRSLTVPVSYLEGLSSYIKPGMRVDIIATKELDLKETTNKLAIAGVILQNVEILSFETDTGGGNPPDSKNNNTPAITKINAITFKVPANSVSKLVVAMQGGKLMIAIRGIDDSYDVTPSPLPSQVHPISPFLGSYRPLTRSYTPRRRRPGKPISNSQYFSKLPNIPAFNDSVEALPSPAKPIASRHEKVEMIQANVKSEVNFSN